MSSILQASSAAALLDLARNARAECNVNQSRFSLAKNALDSLCMELEFCESLTAKYPGLDSSTRRSLETHLSPCQRALSGVLYIRRKYRSEMSLAERGMWKASDGKLFNEAVGDLVLATNLLRSTLRMVEETQVKRKAYANSASKVTGANAPACRNGSGCRIAGCKFSHPDAAPCRFGASCSKPTCTFKHPQSPVCRNGPGCRTPGCTFTHPDAKDCRYGAECSSPDCSFKHPRTPRTPTCRYGTACRNENCKFTHPTPPPPYTKNKPKEPYPMESNRGQASNTDNGSKKKQTTKGRRVKSTIVPEKAS